MQGFGRVLEEETAAAVSRPHRIPSPHKLVTTIFSFSTIMYVRKIQCSRETRALLGTYLASAS